MDDEVRRPDPPMRCCKCHKLLENKFVALCSECAELTRKRNGFFGGFDDGDYGGAPIVEVRYGGDVDMNEYIKERQKVYGRSLLPEGIDPEVALIPKQNLRFEDAASILMGGKSSMKNSTPVSLAKQTDGVTPGDVSTSAVSLEKQTDGVTPGDVSTSAVSLEKQTDGVTPGDVSTSKSLLSCILEDANDDMLRDMLHSNIDKIALGYSPDKMLKYKDIPKKIIKKIKKYIKRTVRKYIRRNVKKYVTRKMNKVGFPGVC
jgi:hypothetical protein